jgi:hypothetical protein
MSDKLPTSTVENPLAPEVSCSWFNDPAIRKLCQRTRGNPLTRDEILLLGLAAGQAALLHYIHPGSAHDAEATINTIMEVLDHDAVGAATHEKARELLAKRKGPYLKGSSVWGNPMLQELLGTLHECEINAQVSVASFYDGWYWRIKLGDELNGFNAERTFTPDEFEQEGTVWLIKEACKQYPEGTFAKRYAPRFLEEAKTSD